MRPILRVLLFSLLLTAYGCKSTQQGIENARIDENGIMDITPSSMNKDAVRLRGKIVKSNGVVEKRNSYDFEVEEVLKFGATFSSVLPGIGETLNLLTPAHTSFKEGQEVIIDALTPRLKRGEGIMRIRLGQP